MLICDDSKLIFLRDQTFVQGDSRRRNAAVSRQNRPAGDCLPTPKLIILISLQSIA